MSRKQKIKQMSSEELQSKLRAHFQKSGSWEHLRAELRGQLVSELFKVAEPVDSDKFPIPSDVDKCLLPFQVCNWLVYDHLSRQDYQYSLSTFVTEAQLPYPEKFLTAGDVLRLLGLSNNTTKFETINKLYIKNNELGCLHSLLLAIIKNMFNVPNNESMLDESHHQNTEVDACNEKKTVTCHEESNHSGAVGNMIFFPNETSMSRQRNINKSIINDEAKSADDSFHEQLQNVKEESQRAVQQLRHKLLQELESLHSQEHKMQIENEQIKSDLRKEQNKLIKEKEMLKEKEALMEKEIANKLEMKLREAESDFASKLYFKNKEIESLKMMLSEKNQKFTYIETVLASEKDNYALIKRELEGYKHMYKTIQDKYSHVLDENTNLLKKFESMSDYNMLKEELASKSKEVTRLHNEIKDIHQRSEAERKEYVQTVRDLEDNLNMKEPQLMQAKKELDQVKNALNTGESIWKKDRKKLEMELSDFKELYKTVTQRMEDQKEDIQELHKTIYTLNYKLNSTATHAQKMESFGSFKNFQKSTDIYQISKPETLFTKRNAFVQQPPEEYNHALKFLSDAKTRGNKLEQEENAVREKYSFISSTIPENNKYDSNFQRYNLVSLPKSNVEGYQTLLAKPASFNADFSFNNYSKNKFSYSKNPYSLNEVKRLVSNSLFPYRTDNQTTFQARDNLDASSELSNAINNRFIDTEIRSCNPNMYMPPQLSENTSARPENTLNKSSIPGDSQTLDSQVKHSSQNQEKLNPVQDVGKNVTVDKPGNFQQESDNVKCPAKSNLAKNIHSLPGVGRNEDTRPLEKSEIISGSHEVTDQNNAVVLDKVQPQSSPVQSETPKKSEGKPEQSTSIFVNLDAAWQRRSSASSLYFNKECTVTDKTSTKHKSDVPSFLTPINRTLSNSKKDISDTDFQNKDKTSDSLKEDFSEIVDNERMKQKTADTLGMQVQIDSKVIDSKNSVENKSESVDPGHTKHFSSDNVGNIEITKKKNSEEQENVKSTDKIASADSLSELSEIHLSCGSEADQQKEDSDAW